MAVTAFTGFPRSIVAGDTLRVNVSYGDYPSASWTATCTLNKSDRSPVTATGTSNGSGFSFAFTAAVTANLAQGAWTYSVRLTETASGDKITAEGGVLNVLPNFANAIDETPAQLQLNAANDALLTLLANPNASVSFNGQSFSKENQVALLDIIARLEAKVKQEQNEYASLSGNPPTRSIRPYFV